MTDKVPPPTLREMVASLAGSLRTPLDERYIPRISWHGDSTATRMRLELLPACSVFPALRYEIRGDSVRSVKSAIGGARYVEPDHPLWDAILGAIAARQAIVLRGDSRP